MTNTMRKAFFHLGELKRGKYSEYTGWMNPEVSKEEMERIKKDSEYIRNNYETLIVIGAGGSYLGAKAVIEALSPKFNREIEVIFMGNNLSPIDMNETLEYLKTKKFFVNVISKSGGTLEPAVAFSTVQKLMFEKYGKRAFEHLIVTTDEKQGELRNFVNEHKVKSYVIPEDVGGRFSVFTAVGLLPIATAGIDVERLILGATHERTTSLSMNNENNGAALYSSLRTGSYLEGRKIEVFATYEPRLKYLGEWWRQLFGETEGKDGKGIFPTTANFSSDLHSIGQIIQDGENNLIETHFVVESYSKDVIIEADENDLILIYGIDDLEMSDLNTKVFEAAVKAHSKKYIPSTIFKLQELNEYELGKKMYLLMVAAALSAMTIEVHPFNQPGVEEYKKNMKL